MKEIYWLTVIGNLHYVLIAIFAILVFVGISSLLLYVFTEAYETKEREVISRFTKKIFLEAICTGIILCFLPSKEDLLAIYGIGGTIDYIQSNDKAKELPDKVVDALTEYLEYVTSDKNKDEKF